MRFLKNKLRRVNHKKYNSRFYLTDQRFLYKIPLPKDLKDHGNHDNSERIDS